LKFHLHFHFFFLSLKRTYRQETYLFYSLPFCKPSADVETHLEGLGEALQGYELRASPIELQYKLDQSKNVICKKTLNQAEADQFHNAIINQYWYQLFVDELPVWGMVGEIDNTQVKILKKMKMKCGI